MFGKKLETPEVIDVPAVEEVAEEQAAPQLQAPEESAVITMGLHNGVNPFIRSQGPVTPHQLSIMHSYLGALLTDRWLALASTNSQSAE
jgi:hypothetical protein